ncbi:O-antigen ligase family protein [Frigoribacterium sp. CFBP9039]|uniref:O-antigen ligase family protein n=1 Tax=unclassified Frigoribacterium TaxID=2627005 RepID=UPI002A6A660D|nr:MULTISPECIES: O-antigen ligase family protein [unclassified Frigoribacterium]MDY0891251.1 O-antigen ligase family protein [Frigoribacterium sp. CFBP9030]MDY0944448.1 O-antigen ligase family protein [Frigoribacterium sp. CFBP9039]
MTSTTTSPPAVLAPRRQGTVFATLAFLVLFGGDVLRNGTSFWGWGVACGAMVVASAVVVARNRPDPRRLPRLLVLFTIWAVVSITWSQYPGASALGIVATLATMLGALAVAWSLPWPLIVAALGRALRIHVGLSLLFELIVATLVRRPVCPVYLDCTGGVPDAFFWSRDVLLEGGRIQGLQGNSNILGILALLALVVTASQWSARTISSRAGTIGVALAIAALLLTRSATTAASGLAVVAVLALVLLVRRTAPPRRPRLYLAAVAAVVVVAVVAVLARTPLLGALGRSSDLTGRTDIWAAVLDLGAQHPVVGWGWVGYWVPWAAPFTDLAERNGVVYLQAHDAYLDVWFQLGWIGLVLFGLVCLGVLARSWWWATDRRVLGVGREAPWATLDLLPLLLVVALLVHGIAESRLIVEWGFALLVVVVVVTRRDAHGWSDHDRVAEPTDALRP